MSPPTHIAGCSQDTFIEIVESGHTDDINGDDVTPIHTQSTEMHAVDSHATTTKEGPSKAVEGTHGRFYVLRTCTESVGPSARHS